LDRGLVVVVLVVVVVVVVVTCDDIDNEQVRGRDE